MIIVLFMLAGWPALQAAYLLIPMDAESQRDHLKAYGLAYWVLEQKVEVYWLLNYRGGSFAMPYAEPIERECKIRNISYEVIPNGEFARIREEIANPEVNMEVMKLEKAPKIAVYTPDFNQRGERIQPWDDAVTLVLTYAEIPFETVYDREVLEDRLAEFDWLHLHHEDFTGQYGKFYASYRAHQWYRENKRRMEDQAKSLGYEKVSSLKLDVVKKIREYCGAGGFMFAMCSATDTYDIALAAEGVDICEHMFDGDGMDPNAQNKLDYSKTFAFENFTISTNPLEYEHSNIDHNPRKVSPEVDYFTLFDFSAKWDPVPTMLTQNHTRTVKGFMGQTTAFRNEVIKPEVLILGEMKPAGEARYLHGTYGLGFWSFFAGHDPEDYRHFVNDPETDLSLHPNSPGYRLILNNILFPAARKKERKT
jgi:hypothetical protein